MIDVHSHILPGIDDGARDFEHSIDILRELSSYGVTDVIATPHYISETEYVSTVLDNSKLLDELKDRIETEKIGINLYLGNEIYIEKNISVLLDKNKITPLAKSKYLLIELPLNEEFPNYAEHFKSLMENGYEVLLAHPERYVIFQNDYDLLLELCEMGVKLQCNLGSVYGKYGKEAKILLKRLAKEKKIFVFGSDVHRPGGKRNLDLARKKLSRLYNERELEKVLTLNAKKIIE